MKKCKECGIEKRLLDFNKERAVCKDCTRKEGRRRYQVLYKAKRKAARKYKYEMHGMKHEPEYSIWKGMKERCLNKKGKSYKEYGGRGIIICKQWINSFLQFYKDMGKRPDKDLQIDRINNDGNYEPDNCRWATRSQQALNRRKRRYINPIQSPGNLRLQ